MNVLGRTFLTVFVATCVACGAPASHVPRTPGTALATAFAGAFRTDAVGASDKAIAAYLRLIRDAAQDDVNPWQVAAIEASLDALVNRSMPAFGTASRDVALIYRTGLADSVTGDLARTAAQAKGPFARGLIARALLTAAQRRGDAVSAARLRQASGCATRALVVGPLSWEPITGPEQPRLGPRTMSAAEAEMDQERVLRNGRLHLLKGKGGVKKWKPVWAVLRAKSLAIYPNEQVCAPGCHEASDRRRSTPPS